jgi:hypothetical protein
VVRQREKTNFTTFTRSAKYRARLVSATPTGLAYPKLLPDSELQAARSQLSQDQYDQEYECSFDAAILGAFYGQEMRLG